jgi:hypothetical protein
MMLTHYYCIGVVLGMGAYVLIVLRGRVRLRILGAFAAAGLAFAILWGPILLQQREAFARWHGSDQGQPNTVSVKFQRLGVAPMRQLTAVFDGSTTHAAICAAVCVSGVLLLWKRRELWLWWLWAFGVMGVLAAHDFLGSEDHLVLPKYALAAGPAIFLLIAAGAQRLPLRSARAQKIATHLIPAAAVLLCLSDASVAYAPYRGNWRDPGRWILEHATGSDAVVFCSAFRRGRSDGWSYLSLFHYTDTAIMPCPVMLLDEPGAHGAAIDQLRGARTVFVVIDSPTDTPESWLRGCRPLVGVYFPHSAAVWAVRMGTPMKSQATDVKSQARNPKSEKKSPVVRGVGIWGLGFASDFGLRISDLQGP